MRVNFLTSVPEPEVPSTDALYNEIHYLKERIGGEFLSFHPYKNRGGYFPRLLAGFPYWRQIKAAEAKTDIHHIYTPKLTAYPFYWALRKPIVLSVVGNLSGGVGLPSPLRLGRLKKIIVSNQRDYEYLIAHKIYQAQVIETGIPATNFVPSPLPLKQELILLMASAPWELGQFHIKGIHLILQTLQRLDKVKVIFIWRNLMVEEMRRLINEYQVEDKVELINERVNINDYLEKAHGTILLCNKGGIVKSYPHSLLESLLAAKPIITSQEIPLADFIHQQGCGLVLDQFEVEQLISCLQQFRTSYPSILERTQQMDKSVFSLSTMADKYRAMYEEVLGS